MEAHRPLEGLLVVDLSRHLPGPLTARILADLGARVVKVEEPREGDPVRSAPPFPGGRSALAGILLAGLESVALDLRQVDAQQVLRALVARADVLLETFRPGTLARFGLAPDELRRSCPRLVICSLTGWGQEGPAAARGGHDLTYQAVAGSLASVPRAPGQPVADLIGSWSSATAILAALRRRDQTGEGSWIDAGLLDAAVHGNLTSWATENASPGQVGEPLLLTGALPCYDVYPTRGGGYLAIGALEPHFWKRFCSLVGRRDLERHQYSRKSRVRRRIAAVVASRTREQWQELLAEADLSVEVVLSPAESLEHPQIRQRGLVRVGEDGVLRPAFPARLEGRRPGVSQSPPEVGENTEAVLRELELGRGGEGIGARPGWRARLRRWVLLRRHGSAPRW